MVKAVIFDMNGVIVVDEQFHNESWIEFCKRYNLALTEDEFRREVMGRRDKDTLDYLFKQKLHMDQANKYADERDVIVEGLVKNKLLLPIGLRILLEEIKQKGIPLAIATSSRRGYVNFIMESFNLKSYFPLIITGEDVVHGKPDPEIYLKTAEKLGIAPEQCLVFEDSLSGIKSAKEAGMNVVAITSTHSKEELTDTADYVIKSFGEFDRGLLQ